MRITTTTFPHAPKSDSETINPPEFTPSAEAGREAVYDQELVRRFHEGDARAFDEIVGRYSARIFGMANNLLRNNADAEEIMQDTFIRAFHGLRNFRGDSSLATWLYRIAINLSRNRYWYFFRRRRHDSISLDLTIGNDSGAVASFKDTIAATSRNPVQEAVTEEFTRLVAECMEKLDPRHREILTMRNILNLSYDEISAALGINVGTVKSRIARARESLRKLLAASAPEFAEVVDPADFFEFLRPAPGCEAIAYA